MADIYYEVMRILERANALTPQNNRAALMKRVEDLGIGVIFIEFIKDNYGKERIAELSDDEIADSHDYVNRIYCIVEGGQTGRLQ